MLDKSNPPNNTERTTSRPSNGIEVGISGKYLRVSGQQFLLLLILAATLAYVVWDVVQKHKEIVQLINARCIPLIIN